MNKLNVAFFYTVFLILLFFCSCTQFLDNRPKTLEYKIINTEDLIPFDDEVKSWEMEGKTELFNRRTIFEYLNGGAELYLENRFAELVVQEYTSKDYSEEIIVEVYRMGEGEWASKIFSFELVQNAKTIHIGEKGQFIDNYLTFWQSNFFVRVYCLDDDPEIEKQIQKFGKLISLKIDRFQ